MNDGAHPMQERPLTTGGWMMTLLVLALPVVNIIMYLVWALGGGNAGRRNFCRASILWFLIAMVIYGVFLGVVALTGATVAYST